MGEGYLRTGMFCRPRLREACVQGAGAGATCQLENMVKLRKGKGPESTSLQGLGLEQPWLHHLLSPVAPTVQLSPSPRLFAGAFSAQGRALGSQLLPGPVSLQRGCERKEKKES